MRWSLSEPGDASSLRSGREPVIIAGGTVCAATPSYPDTAYDPVTAEAVHRVPKCQVVDGLMLRI